MKANWPRIARLIGINSLLFIAFSCVGGAFLNQLRRGTIYIPIPDDGFIRNSRMRGDSKHQPPKWVGDNAPERYEENCFSIHPYFGFADACTGKGDMGFTKETSLADNILQGEARILRILVLGGSVASHISKRTSLEKELEEAIKSNSTLSSQYTGVSVFNAGLGGYKQPQQSIILSTLLSEGFKFDAIVNINGFNELALPLSENYTLGISPILPRSHNLREAKEHEYLSGQRSSSLFTKVALVADTLFAWHTLYPYVRSRTISKLLQKERSHIARSITVSQPYRFNLPLNEDEAFVKAKKIWVKSSLNSYLIAKGNGIPYYEYIQPNQYLERSKKLTLEERQSAITINHLYGKFIRKYYSKISLGDFAIPRGQIWDGRELYKNISETVYVDDCCHMNSYGMKLMAQDISRRLLAEL
jgi:hypothetical protein